MNAGQLLKDEPKKFNLLIENVQDFHIKKDFMFATRKVPNNTQLFISYRRGPFIKADFQTELEIKVSYDFGLVLHSNSKIDLSRKKMQSKKKSNIF